MKTKKVPRTRRTVITFTAFLSPIYAPPVPNTAVFCPLSVAKSCRYRCRDLQRWKGRRKSLRRDVDNCHHHSWNQHLTPAVAESTAPVVKPLTFPPAYHSA